MLKLECNSAVVVGVSAVEVQSISESLRRVFIVNPYTAVQVLEG